MNTSSNKRQEIMDFEATVRLMWENKKDFIKWCSIAFVLGCIWIFPQPRTYTSEVTLAPETESISGGSLSSLASSFGINMMNQTSSDAIYPMLYPDLLDSSPFIVSLFDIQVETIDGELKTDYYDYLFQHQKQNPYTFPYRWLKRTVKNLLNNDNDEEDTGEITPFKLSKEQHDIVESIRNKVSVVYNNNNNVVSIEVTDQDPLICAVMADSIRVRLQNFITDYRTSKAKTDYEYFKKLTIEAKQEYEKSLREYSSYADAHTNTIWTTTTTTRDKLNKEQAKKYETYSAFNTQMEAALAKIQERTPAFTVIQCASVPVKATGPKRLIFVAFMVLLAAIIVALRIIRKEKGQIIKIEL